MIIGVHSAGELPVLLHGGRLQSEVQVRPDLLEVVNFLLLPG